MNIPCSFHILHKKLNNTPKYKCLPSPIFTKRYQHKYSTHCTHSTGILVIHGYWFSLARWKIGVPVPDIWLLTCPATLSHLVILSRRATNDKNMDYGQTQQMKFLTHIFHYKQHLTFLLPYIHLNRIIC